MKQSIIENLSTLELFALQVFKSMGEPMEENDIQILKDRNSHVLSEFLEGYKTAPNAYAETEEDLELINEFIRIVENEIDHGQEATPEELNKVSKALNKFGL